MRIHGGYDKEKYTLMKILKFFRLPVVWEINAPLQEGSNWGMKSDEIRSLHRKRKLFARLVNAAICVSKELKEYAAGELGIKRSFVVPNGSDPELFTPQKRDASIYSDHRDCFKLIWAGSTSGRWHGLKMILEVARIMEVVDPKVTFIFIGDRKRFEEDRPYPRNVLLLDQKNYLEMPPYLASADAGLCFYTGEQSGMKFYRSPLKLFDYMACGLPVIATRAGQISEVIQDKRNGLLVDNNLDEIIKNILLLKNNRDMASQIGREARATIERYYNWGRVAEETEGILRRLIRKNVFV
jgi:glycosyltransferase involved in cell wall biosynthesis